MKTNNIMYGMIIGILFLMIPTVTAVSELDYKVKISAPSIMISGQDYTIGIRVSDMYSLRPISEATVYLYTGDKESLSGITNRYGFTTFKVKAPIDVNYWTLRVEAYKTVNGISHMGSAEKTIKIVSKLSWS